MSASTTGSQYDRYWLERDVERTRARSRARAALALRLLTRAGRTGGRLLEVGCGPGWALDVFRAAGYDASGVDVSREAAERARERGLRVLVGDLERWAVGGPGAMRELGTQDGLIDAEVLVALEVLEHLVDPLGVLTALSTGLAAGSHLVVSLPNEFHLLRRLQILAGCVSFGGHRDPHLRYFDERKARSLFAEAGLRVLARLDDSLVPPRARLSRALARPLVAVAPRLLSLSHVFLLTPNAT